MERLFIYKKEYFGKSVNPCYKEEGDTEMPWKLFFVMPALIQRYMIFRKMKI